jgi:hypothetical protein
MPMADRGDDRQSDALLFQAAAGCRAAYAPAASLCGVLSDGASLLRRTAPE